MMRLFALFLIGAGFGGWLAAPFASAQPVAQSPEPVSVVSESWQFFYHTLRMGFGYSWVGFSRWQSIGSGQPEAWQCFVES